MSTRRALVDAETCSVESFEKDAPAPCGLVRWADGFRVHRRAGLVIASQGITLNRPSPVSVREIMAIVIGDVYAGPWTGLGDFNQEAKLYRIEMTHLGYIEPSRHGRYVES